MFDNRFMLNAPYEYAKTLEDWSPFVKSDNSGHFIFELRRAHITLWENARWEWDSNFEPGAPVVDAKKPFGSGGRHQIPRDIYQALSDGDPDTLVDLGISDDFEELDRDAADDSTQALFGVWQEIPLAMSLLLSCVVEQVVPAIGSQWIIGRDEVWRPYAG